MDLTTIIGILLGFTVIVFGITDGGKLLDFYDFGSVLITIGGTIFATFASFPLNTFTKIPKHFKILTQQSKIKPQDYINILVELAQEARRKGILALEDKAKEQKDPFLVNSIMLIVDAIEPEKAREILENELNNLDTRHGEAWKLYEKSAQYAPAFGMIGTLIGLVNMLKHLDLEAEGGATALAGGMSTALITTFYGVILANLLFMPISNKLRIRHDEEMLCKEIIVEGVLAIQSGENPNHIKERLMTYLNSMKRTGDGKKKEAKQAPEKSKAGKKQAV